MTDKEQSEILSLLDKTKDLVITGEVKHTAAGKLTMEWYDECHPDITLLIYMVGALLHIATRNTH